MVCGGRERGRVQKGGRIRSETFRKARTSRCRHRPEARRGCGGYEAPGRCERPAIVEDAARRYVNSMRQLSPATPSRSLALLSIAQGRPELRPEDHHDVRWQGCPRRANRWGMRDAEHDGTEERSSRTGTERVRERWLRSRRSMPLRLACA